MTTLEILQIARRKLLEVTTEVLPEDIMLIYANESYNDVWKRAFSNSDIKTTSLSLTNGEVTLPTNIGTLYAAAQDADGNIFEEVPIADFNRGTLDRMVTIENGILKAVPTTTSSLTIRYWEKPETLTNAVDPSIDSFLHEPIIYGILWRAYEDLQDEELVTYYKQRFFQELKDKINAQSNYEENNKRGGVMFFEQNLI